MALNVKSFGEYYRKVMDKYIIGFTRVYMVTKWMKNRVLGKK